MTKRYVCVPRAMHNHFHDNVFENIRFARHTRTPDSYPVVFVSSKNCAGGNWGRRCLMGMCTRITRRSLPATSDHSHQALECPPPPAQFLDNTETTRYQSARTRQTFVFKSLGFGEGCGKPLFS